MGSVVKIRTALLAGGMFAAMCGAALAANDDAAPARDNADAFTTTPSQDNAPGVTIVGNAVEGVALSPAAAIGGEGESTPRRLELEFAAGGAGSPIDIAIAQRTSLGSDLEGETNFLASGAELRVGRGLVAQHGQEEGRSVYMFVASDNEALTWRPGTNGALGARGAALALQDRVDVGDVSAGVTYELAGVQTSLAYVERQASTRVGRQTFSRDENFAGVTVTLRR